MAVGIILIILTKPVGIIAKISFRMKCDRFNFSIQSKRVFLWGTQRTASAAGRLSLWIDLRCHGIAGRPAASDGARDVLRHALYSASMAPYFKNLSPLWKLLLGYLLTDEAYGVGITRYVEPSNEPFKHWFVFGAGLTLWAGWQVSSACGIFLGAQISPAWSLDFALPLVFIALLVPMLKDRAGLAAAAAGGVVSVMAFGLPYKLGILIAALIGISVGLWSERK
jgi:hypothetical protein